MRTQAPEDVAIHLTSFVVKLLVGMILWLGCASAAVEFAASVGARYIAVNNSPPEVIFVDSERLTRADAIPIGGNPGPYLLSRSSDALYLVHNSCATSSLLRSPPPSTLSVVDLKARNVRKTFDLSWNISSLFRSEDGLRVLAIGAGRPDLKNPKPEQYATLHALDTQAVQVSSVRAGFLLLRVLATRDRSRIFALTAATSVRGSGTILGAERLPLTLPTCLMTVGARIPKDGSFALKILDPARSRAVAEIPLPEAITDILLSKDERWLYLFDTGRLDSSVKRRRGGAVHIVDVQKAVLSGTYAVGTFPRTFDLDPVSGELRVAGHKGLKDHHAMLFRFLGNDRLPAANIGEDPLALTRVEGGPDSLLTTPREICRIDEHGQPRRPCINLAKLHPTKTGKPIAFGFAQNRLVEVTTLADRNQVLVRTGTNGDRVAFADWNSGEFTDLITIGRPGARLRNQSRNTAARAALAGIFMMGCGGALGCGNPWMPEVIDPEFWTSVPPIVRPDGCYVYVANTYTTDVAAVDTGNHAVVAYFPLGGRARGLFFSPDRNLVCAYSKNRFIVIDAATNVSVLEATPPGGIRLLTFSRDGSQILAVTDHQIAGWSTKTFRPIGVLKGLSRPSLVLDQDSGEIRQP